MSAKHVKAANELPFEGVAIETQLKILKTFAVLHEKGKSGASYKEVAPLANISPTKVSPCLSFWKSIGLLEEKDGKYDASSVTLEFSRKIDWDADAGWLIMRRHLAGTWFGEQIVLAFKVKKSLTEDGIVKSIGLGYGVPKKKEDALKRSLKSLLELLELSKFVIKNEKGEYALNTEMPMVSQKEPAEISEDKGLIKIRIGKEMYIVDSKELQEFVTTHGKKLAENEIRLE